MKILIGIGIGIALSAIAFFALQQFHLAQSTTITEPSSPKSVQETKPQPSSAKPATGDSVATYTGTVTYSTFGPMELEAQYTIAIQYRANCSLYDGFIIDTGDGHTYPADCGSTLMHKYPGLGSYTIRYLHGDQEIARTVANITK